jgi:hypothetical protein
MNKEWYHLYYTCYPGLRVLELLEKPLEQSATLESVPSSTSFNSAKK